MTMFTSRKAFALLVLVVSLATSAFVANSADDGGWQASYWNNASLEGSPTVTRSERMVDYVFGESSPVPGTINNDNFSARWTRTINLQPGTYRFTMSSDDGSRVLVNGQTILDQWYDHPLRTASAEMYLPGGDTQITVEYFERSHSATASFKYTLVKPDGQPQQSAATQPAQQQPSQPVAASQPPAATAAQLSSCAGANYAASYYNNPNLQGTPSLSRTDATVNFNWGEGSPAGGISSDGFSVRWTATINLQAGSYLIALAGDDGLRLSLNGDLRVNDWFAQPLTTRTLNLDHAGGPLSVRIEHFDQTGFSKVGFSCTRLGNYNGPPLQTVAEVTAAPAAPAVPAVVPTQSAEPTSVQSTSPVAPVTPPAALPSAGSCQISNVYHLNLREGPSLSTAVVGRVSYGEMTTLTGGRSGKYVQVRNARGEEGWINRYYCGNAELPPQQLTATAPTATSATASVVVPAPAPACNGVMVTASALMVRGGPDITHLWYDIANSGDTLCLTGNRNEAATWVEVTTKNGVRGWVFCAYTTISYDQLYALTPTQ